MSTEPEIFVKLVVATSNRGKIREIEAILRPLGAELITPADVSDPPEVVEDGDTFLENAVKKAEAFARATGLTALADDSGLCVEALDGRPGVRSARYAGPGATDADNVRKLIGEMESVPDGGRGARFECVIALSLVSGRTFTFEGSCQGVITREPLGESGFGYDPVFFVPEYGRTMAQVGPDIKNRISHRAAALTEMQRRWPEVTSSLDESVGE